MILWTSPPHTTTGPSPSSIVVLDEAEQRAERSDAALVMDLEHLVDTLVFGGLTPGEVDAVLLARGAVLALARHVLAAATAPAPGTSSGGPTVPASLVTMTGSLAAYPDVAPAGHRAPATERARAWSGLGRAAAGALDRRATSSTGAGAGQDRWTEISYGMRLASLLVAVDRRLLAGVKAAATVDLATVRALGAVTGSELSAAVRVVADLSRAR